MCSKKVVRLLCLCAAIVCMAAVAAYAQEDPSKFPTRPINFIVPFSPGSNADLAFRLIGREAEKVLGQPIIVINKPGAGGTIGLTAVASAKPNGYTIGHSPGQVLFVMSQLESLPYSPKDITYIMQAVDIYFAIYVKGSSPFKSFPELMAWAKNNPKKLTYATNGPMSTAHVTMEYVTRKEGVQAVHIPFKGSPEINAAIMGDHVVAAAGDYIHSLVESGQVRFLVFLGDRRNEEYPQVPVLTEFGYDIPCPALLNVTAPKGLPPVIRKKLEDAFAKAMKQPSVLKGLKEMHLTPRYRSGEELERYAANTYTSFSRILKEMGFSK